MVKVVVVNKKDSFLVKRTTSKQSSPLEKEHNAIRIVTSARKSAAYREAVAAKVPVTYVTGGKVVKEIDGQKIVVRKASRSVSVKTIRK